MSATEQNYQRKTLGQIARRLSEAASDLSDLKRLSRQLRFWFGTIHARSAQVAATRVEEACQKRKDPTRLVWALEHEVARLLGTLSASPA